MRGFSLIDEKETLEEMRENEKKFKMVIDEMQLCQVLVEEASQNGTNQINEAVGIEL